MIADAHVELPPELVHLAGVLAPRSPAASRRGDRPEQHDERRRRGDVHARADQPSSLSDGSCSQAARKKLSSGTNMIDEVGRRLELAPVALCASLPMWSRTCRAWSRGAAADALRPPLPRRRRGTPRAGPWRRRRPACRPGSGRRDRAAAGRPRRRASSLLLEVAVGEQAGRLDDVPELHLAPAATYVRRAQRLDEVAGLEPEALAACRKRVQMLRDGAVRLLAHLLHPAHLAVHPLERVLQRRRRARSAGSSRPPETTSSSAGAPRRRAPGRRPAPRRRP